MDRDASTASPSPWKTMYCAKTAHSEFHSGTVTGATQWMANDSWGMDCGFPYDQSDDGFR
jgi:hypothetical protein